MPTTFIVRAIESRPYSFSATSVTRYSPSAANVTTGFCSVEDSGVPFAKVQLHDVGKFVDKSLNCTESPFSCNEALYEKSATGASPCCGSVTVMYYVSVLVFSPQAFVTVSETWYVPGVEYTTRGFSSVDVAGLPPSNVHERLA